MRNVVVKEIAKTNKSKLNNFIQERLTDINKLISNISSDNIKFVDSITSNIRNNSLNKVHERKESIKKYLEIGSSKYTNKGVSKFKNQRIRKIGYGFASYVSSKKNKNEKFVLKHKGKQMCYIMSINHFHYKYKKIIEEQSGLTDNSNTNAIMKIEIAEGVIDFIRKLKERDIKIINNTLKLLFLCNFICDIWKRVFQNTTNSDAAPVKNNSTSKMHDKIYRSHISNILLKSDTKNKKLYNLLLDMNNNDSNKKLN
jgi:hypothetical protein